MKYEYKRIVTNTLENLRKAEKLKEQGWKIISSSMFEIIFEKPVK